MVAVAVVRVVAVAVAVVAHWNPHVILLGAMPADSMTVGHLEMLVERQAGAMATAAQGLELLAAVVVATMAVAVVAAAALVVPVVPAAVTIAVHLIPVC